MPQRSSTSAPSADTERLRPSLAALIQLEQSARLLAAGRPNARAQLSGNYLARFKGRGMEFDESRLYTPGDDIRNLDWRVTARTGKAHTKLFREERERPVLLSVDARPSMFFATRGSFKYVQAARMAALLAWSARAHGDRIGGQVFGARGRREQQPAPGRQSVLRLLNLLAATEAETGGGIAPEACDQALIGLQQHAKPGTLICVFSDFRGLTDTGESALARLSRHCEIMLGFVVDPIEQALPATGERYRFSDGHATVAIDALTETLKRHAEAHIARFERLRSLARGHRLRLVTCTTTDDPLAVLQTGWRSKPAATTVVEQSRP